MTDAAARLAEIRQNIARATKLAHRSPDSVTLVSISKTQTPEAIRPLLDAGQRDFGENRVQEAEGKWPELRADYPDIRLHLVGQLQSNKAEAAAALFDVIHSVDRPSLIKALAMVDARPDCFVQVNIGAEPQKGGCEIADTPALVASAREAGLNVVGLMCVPPEGIEASPFFALLAKMAKELGLRQLSTGMSADYEAAVMLGATHVRIGSALFGPRA